MNYNIKIDLLKIKGAFIHDIKGKSGEKKCLVIPIDEAGCLFQGKQGLYLDMTAYESKEERFGQTHYIKPDINKETRDKMTEEERKAVAILGGMKVKNRPSSQSTNEPFVAEEHVSQSRVEDLPF